MMFFSRSISVVAAFAALASCSPTSQADAGVRVVESLAAPPEGWVKDSSAKMDKESHMVKLRIHLVHQDMDKFHDLAMKASRPTSGWSRSDMPRLRLLDMSFTAAIFLSKSSTI